MAITSNESEAPRPSNESAPKSAFTSTAESAPKGTLDFLGLSGNIGIPRIDASVEPYLTKVITEVKKYIPSAELVRFPRRNNYHAVLVRGDDGLYSVFEIMFASLSDGIHAKFIPTSYRMQNAMDDLREMYPGKQIRRVDQRLIIAGYEGDMNRWFEMANTIVSAFNVQLDPAYKDATISQISTVEFSPDWSLAHARALADQLSPHGIRARMDLGMVLRAKVVAGNQREMRDADTEYRPVGVIGGYVEFREKELVQNGNVSEQRYYPVFNITVCQSVIPLEGMAAVLLAAIAPQIYSSLWWTRQWNDFAKDKPNIGSLELDPAKPGHTFFTENSEEVVDFVKNWVTTPDIAFQLQDGKDAIPGLYRMFSNHAEEKLHFLQRLTHFFEVDSNDVASNATPSGLIDVRFEGGYGDASGVLHDSRNIDFLEVAAKTGAGSIDAQTRATLLGRNADRPEDRAALVAHLTSSFIPLYMTPSYLINPDFITWIQSKLTGRIQIIDPNHQVEGRSFGAIRQGFGSGAGMGSIISSGIVRGGLNLQSNWNR